MNPQLYLVPTLAALFLYGIGQGLVKKYIGEVAPARYCFYFFFAKAAVNLGYWIYGGHPSPLLALGTQSSLMALGMGTLAYVLEGAGWICYYESIVSGPISIVGTLSAAYAAPTVLFAYFLLGETLQTAQYVGVAAVIVGCMGLAYSPPDPDAKSTDKRWIPLALTALILWGLWQTLVKHTYNTFTINKTQHVTEPLMALYNTLGAFLTLGLYGIRYGRQGTSEPGEWVRSVVPMVVMASGDLGVLIATAMGPASVVTPLSGAYPVVTLGFASVVLKERITLQQWCFLVLVLAGMFFSLGPQ